MSRGRLEAFSDGVLAIVITIMVLELVPPHESTVEALVELWPKFLAYVMSFIYIGIYWVNHHHLLHTTKTVTGSVLWANMHLLFWLSLVPFVTGWMGENHFDSLPTALYGVVLLMAAIAYTILQCAIIAEHGRESPLAQALGIDFKGKLSMACYALAIALSFVNQWFADGLYVLVALLWFIPDRRIERRLGQGRDV
jgi:uncharacterized membrane protein